MVAERQNDPGRRYRLSCLAFASLFIGGVPLFLFGVFLFLGPLSLVDAGFSCAGSLAADACLSVFFFVQHSSMIRREFRVRVENYISREYYPALYSIVSGISLLLVLGLWQRVSHVIWETSDAWSWTMRALFFLALAGYLWGAGSFRQFDPFGTRHLIVLARGKTPRPISLVAHGAYRWMRHPLYFFSVLMIWAYPVVTFDRLLFNILWSGWVVVGTVLEERDLVHEFGEEYRQYQARVPMMIPYRFPR